MDNRRATISMALIALICFFLPWVQLSCGTSERRLSGVDLARDGHSGLWLIPLLMLVILFVHLARRSEEHTSELQSQSNLVCRLLLEKKKINKNNRIKTNYIE